MKFLVTDIEFDFDDSHLLECGIESKEYEQKEEYQPDLYYYWDSPIEEDYDWRDAEPDADCLCEICFDILNREKKIKWKCESVAPKV